MNRALVDRLVNAVLYEGYILYPYRPSVKNRQRWTFGGLYPEAHCRGQGGSDNWNNQTECLVHGSTRTGLEVTVRFLHLTARVVGEGAKPPFRPVEVLRVGDKLFHTWQEAEEREINLGEMELGAILDRAAHRTFTFPGRQWTVTLPGSGGEIVGALMREQQEISGSVEVTAARVGEGLFRVTLRVRNGTPLGAGEEKGRDEALLRSLISTHAILAVRRAEFVSLLDPPEPWRAAAAACRNVGTWPVLVGEEGQKDMMVSSPIILYDYPQVAPESAGDFFDSTEIDEMLMLRVLTLTDDEKRAMEAVDEHARALLARTEAFPSQDFLRLHGAIRGLRPVPEEGGHE
jgi:hydrogenase maturation protease